MERAFKTKLILNNTEQTYMRHCCNTKCITKWRYLHTRVGGLIGIGDRGQRRKVSPHTCG